MSPIRRLQLLALAAALVAACHRPTPTADAAPEARRPRADVATTLVVHNQNFYDCHVRIRRGTVSSRLLTVPGMSMRRVELRPQHVSAGEIAFTLDLENSGLSRGGRMDLPPINVVPDSYLEITVAGYYPASSVARYPMPRAHVPTG